MRLRKEFVEWFRRKFSREVLEVLDDGTDPEQKGLALLIVTDGSGVRACLLQTRNVPEGCRP